MLYFHILSDRIRVFLLQENDLKKHRAKLVDEINSNPDFSDEQKKKLMDQLNPQQPA